MANEKEERERFNPEEAIRRIHQEEDRIRHSPGEIWAGLLGDQELGHQVGSLLALIAMIPRAKLAEVCAKAIADISHQETVGPLLFTSLWWDGRRSENAQRYKRVISLLMQLRNELGEVER